MTKKKKRWSELAVDELAAATRVFDDPNYQPPALQPSKRDLDSLRHVQRKAVRDRFRVAVALDEELIDQADEYALAHGMTFSDLVGTALRRMMRKRSA